LRQDIESPK